MRFNRLERGKAQYRRLQRAIVDADDHLIVEQFPIFLRKLLLDDTDLALREINPHGLLIFVRFDHLAEMSPLANGLEIIGLDPKSKRPRTQHALRSFLDVVVARLDDRPISVRAFVLAIVHNGAAHHIADNDEAIFIYERILAPHPQASHRILKEIAKAAINSLREVFAVLDGAKNATSYREDRSAPLNLEKEAIQFGAGTLQVPISKPEGNGLRILVEARDAISKKKPGNLFAVCAGYNEDQTISLELVGSRIRLLQGGVTVADAALDSGFSQVTLTAFPGGTCSVFLDTQRAISTQIDWLRQELVGRVMIACDQNGRNSLSFLSKFFFIDPIDPAGWARAGQSYSLFVREASAEKLTPDDTSVTLLEVP